MEIPFTCSDFPSFKDVPTDVGAIVGGAVVWVSAVIVIAVLVIWVVLRRRKQQKYPNKEVLESINRNEEIDLPLSVQNEIEKQGIDFLLRISPEHERYRRGIAQTLKIPVELLTMSKEDIKTFVRNYKEGSTKVYCGRGMVVGCFGAGKTTLVKKLKGEVVSSPSASTRGLEVHTNIFIVDKKETGLTVNEDQQNGQRLCINLESLESEVVKPPSIAELSNPKTVAEIPKTTIPQVLTDTSPAESMRELEIHANISTGNEDKIGLRGNKDQKKGQRFQMHSESMGSGVVKTSSNETRLNLPSPKMETGSTSVQSDEAGKGPVIHSVIIKQSTEKDVDETEANQQVQRRDEDTILSNVSDKSVKTISLLDFAGQGAYYACHHIFLSPRTFYMLVTDMSKKLSITPTEDAHAGGLMYGGWTHQDYINHWLGSIHTYSSETAPVILVLSHSEGKEKEEEKTYFRKVKLGVTKVLQAHLRLDRTYAVEKDSDKNMQEIKTCMLSIVKDQSHWGESIPTSWVHLEACLMEIKKQQKVVKKKDLWEILPSQIKKGIPSEEDMTTALKLFNDIGVILYTSSSESIILDVQWFVDAFKNIITDEDHAKLDIQNHFNEWEEFSKNGILPKDLVKEIWIGSESFTKYTEDLLLHMIRLGMVAKMGIGDKFYVPCMNKQKYDKDVLRNCACSSTICFMFEYLPLVIFHRLIATCMTKDGWEIWNGNNMGKTGQTSECVFHTAAMLEDKEDLKMLIGITEKKEHLSDKKNTHPYSIEIQGFLYKDQQMQKQFPPRKLERIRKHLKYLTSCFEANRSMTFMIGYRCSIAPFSDTPDSHIILESAKECASCRKTEGIDNLKSFWMADATSENETTEIARKEHILSDTGLVYVATRLGAEWSLVAVSLGLKQAEIDQIKLDNSYNTHTQIYTALQKWRDRQGDQTDDTLLQRLFTALETCDRTDLVEEIQQKYNIPEPNEPDDKKENVPDEEPQEPDNKKENAPNEESHEPDDKNENVPAEEPQVPDVKKENVPDEDPDSLPQEISTCPTEIPVSQTATPGRDDVMDGDECATLSEPELKKLNFKTFDKLMKIGRDALQIYFDRIFPPNDLATVLNDNKESLQHGHYKFNPDQCTILFPADGSIPSSAAFDVTIMYKLLRNYGPDLPTPTNGWGKKPDIGQILPTDDVERIRLYRNEVEHKTEATSVMETGEFKLKWEDLSQAILRLSNGSLKEDVMALRQQR